MSARIYEFWAVTHCTNPLATSLYRACLRIPRLHKLELRGTSRIPAGAVVEGGSNYLRLAILNHLRFIFPNSSIDPAKLCPDCWGPGTSAIVGLFLEEDKARDCFNTTDLSLCDPRWHSETIGVLRAVDGHYNCSISTTGRGYWLMPPEQWREAVAA